MSVSWSFDNSYLSLPEQLYSRVTPTSVSNPELVAFNAQLTTELGLDALSLNASAAEFLSGNQVPNGSEPIAQAYAGHQFGNFTRLGDGRAILLGEILTPDGLRFDLQLKGSGQTPYSRRGDGRAALGPMLREFIISEAMHALGIPTTRSLAVVKTGDPVFRERTLPGAVLTRIAASHIRVGTFEFAARLGVETVKKLADYTIHRHFRSVAHSDHVYHDFLQQVISRQAYLIAQWMKYGFIHGVMNTDNMSISGETIDYGPCAFLDRYHYDQVYSSIDHNGRYAYGNQPKIAQWNLARLAETLLPLLNPDLNTSIAIAEQLLSEFKPTFEMEYFAAFRSKLGIFQRDVEDDQLVSEFLSLLEEHRLDFTNSFRSLVTQVETNSNDMQDDPLKDWKTKWQRRLKKQPQSTDQIRQLIINNSPAYIPRNHLVERSLAAAEKNNFALFHELIAVISKPFEEGAASEKFVTPPTPDEEVCQTFCGT
jgi:uncharacterized protein YdiU (UPF0061 family)